MDRRKGSREELAALDRMIREITVDAHGDHEQLWAFLQAFQQHVKMPADGFVIGEPVSVIRVNYDDNQRRGLTATCHRQDGSQHVVGLPEVVLPASSPGGQHIAAYRRWLNLDPFPANAGNPTHPRREHKASSSDLDLSRPVELIALSVSDSTARCRAPGSDRVITLRAGRMWTVVPGAIATVMPRKMWIYAGHPYLSGEIQSVRIDAAALGLVPLGLEEMGLWDPGEQYWGEDDDPIEEWAVPIIARGPRFEFEMEQVLPGNDPDDPDEDPIIRSNDLKRAGDREGAVRILMDLCRADLRCLDAHAHLGNLLFDGLPKDAMPHYEVGVRIGELTLGEDFDGVLPWGLIDNRPFLRCLHGYGLCLWRLGRFDESERVFDRMLWLNPMDQQGERFNLYAVRAGKTWEEIEQRETDRRQQRHTRR